MKEQVGCAGTFMQVSDDELIANLDQLARQERRTGAEIIAHLVEMERRRLHLDLGYSSLYVYCALRLGMSKDVAYKRMRVARAAKAFPEIMRDLEHGALSLTTVAVVAPHLGRRGGRGLLEAARGKSRSEVERVIAEWDPKVAPGPLAERPRLEAVAGGRVRMTVTVPERVTELIEQAVAIDRHLDPTGDVAALMERALACYLAKRKRQRYAERPVTKQSLSESHEPSTDDRELGSENRGRMTGDREPSTDDRELGSENRGRMTGDRELSTDDRELGSENRGRMIDNRAPRTEHREPGSENRAPRTVDREPSTENRGSTSDEREPSTESRVSVTETQVAEGRRTRTEPTRSPMSTVRHTRTIPAKIRRAVVERDEHRCTFVGRDGHRCTEVAFLELDHVQPRALGGGHAELSAVQLLCVAHNQRRAERSYGYDYVEAKRSSSRSSSPRGRQPERADELDELARDALEGLVGLGFSRAQARRGVEEARAASSMADPGSEPSLELFLRRALSALAPLHA